MDSLPWPTHLFLVSISHLFPLPFLLCGDFCSLYSLRSFPGRSAGKESAWNPEDPGSISGSERPPGEEIGYPLQYSWATLVAQTAKNPPAMWETWVQSLSWEDLLEEGMATHSCILAGESHGQRSLEGYSPWGCKDLDITEQLSTVFKGF